MKTLLIASVLGLSTIANAGLVTSVGYEHNGVVDKEGVTFQAGIEQNNLRVMGNVFVDTKNDGLNKIQSYGVSVNPVIAVKRIELTPGIGYDWYDTYDKGRFNLNLGADYKVTNNLLIGARVKQMLGNDLTNTNEDGRTVQGVVTVKW